MLHDNLDSLRTIIIGYSFIPVGMVTYIPMVTCSQNFCHCYGNNIMAL